MGSIADPKLLGLRFGGGGGVWISVFIFGKNTPKKKKKWFSHKTRNPLKVLSVTLDPFVVCFMCKPLIVLHITPLRFLSVTQNSHGSVLCEIFNSKFSHKTKLQGGTLGGGGGLSVTQ